MAEHPVRSMLGRALLTLPDAVLERHFSGVIGYRSDDVPGPITPRDPDAAVRLLIAPANYAAQGHAWARAFEAASGGSAQNLTVGPAAVSRFVTDDFVRGDVFAKSHRWGQRQASAVADGFTHVLVEAERSILGRHLRGDVLREHACLKDAGLAVAYVSHGSDLRQPALHADSDEWSPFRDTDWDLLPALDRVTRENHRLLDEVDERVFVVTPELLRDRPDAVWLPNTVAPSRWYVERAPLSDGDVRLVHAPTNPRIKGTHLIEPVIERLVARGGFAYRRLEGVAPAGMPEVYQQADVVLEQFRLGIYSTTAVEAMAAGRVVVAHVADDIRASVRRRTGRDVPIVQATPRTLGEVLTDIRSRPDHYRHIAAQGPEFVEAVHSGAFAAAELLSFTGSPAVD